MKEELSQNLILIGYPSSGKSYFGSLLSHKLKCPFIDTDRFVEELYQNKYQEKESCREIFLKLGEDGFRKLEKKVIDHLHVHRAVIAVGGGTLLNADNCSKLEKLGIFVYLEADSETIKKRILSQGIPSFLDSQNLDLSFEKMFAERRLIYETMATFRIKIQGKAESQILDELAEIYSLSKFIL